MRMGIKLDINGSQNCPCGIQMEVQSGQKKEAGLDATGETSLYFMIKVLLDEGGKASRVFQRDMRLRFQEHAKAILAKLCYGASHISAHS